MKNDIAKVFTDVLQLSTLYQFNAILDLKYVVKGVLLPNASVGEIAPTGSVIVTNDKPHTEWLGKDYGILVVKTDFNRQELETNIEFVTNGLLDLIKKGFIEVLYGADNKVWVLIRSIGDKSSRKSIWTQVQWILGLYSKGQYASKELFDIQENSIEEKDGMFIHRIGAIKSDSGVMGVTLGNIRDGSFITSGKGYKDSINSSACSSGVILQSPKSKATTDGQVIDSCLKDVYCVRDEGFCYKPPYIYKNPFHVMEQQSKMIEIVEHIRPLIHMRW